MAQHIRKNEDKIYFEKSLDLLDDDGYIVALVPDFLLDSSQERIFRLHLLNLVSIEAVFSVGEPGAGIGRTRKYSDCIFL